MQSFLYFGLLLGFIWSAWTISNTAAVFCTCRNITLCEEQCKTHEGVHSLSCFGKRYTQTMINYYCVWNPGPFDKYSLYIKQRRCSSKSMQNPFPLINANMTAFAIALSDDEKRCTFAKFSSSPSQIIQCGPPLNVVFRRKYGGLNVMAEWDDSNVEQYRLKYREYNTTTWNEVKSHNRANCTIGDLIPSQPYEMILQCVVTTKCPQCPYSEVIRVPQELVAAPVVKYTPDELIHTGQRKIIVKWEYVHNQEVEDYVVAIQKASGETAEKSNYSLKLQTITLFLCYSAYHLSVVALNKAGPSPPAHLFIEAVEDQRDVDRTFNITLNTLNSFTLSWNQALSRKYACYSVEWWAINETLAYETFYARKNIHTIQTQKAEFQPYKRYHFFLHTRHEKDTCNLKKVNNSDETYGRTQVYLTEGAPLTAPGNLSSSNVTQNSFVIAWSPVSEENMRGFLQGYIIHYTHQNSQRNITIHPSLTSYELLNLQSGVLYCVHVSAYTAAGEGPQNEKCVETLDSVAIGGVLAGLLTGVSALLLATHLCFQLLKRSKKLLWPNIPNPWNSNAVQKIEDNQELEVMELLNRPNIEETEEHVSVLEAKKEPHSACNVSHDWTKASFMSVSPSAGDNRPPSPPTATFSSSNQVFSIDSHPCTEDQPLDTNDMKDPTDVLDTVSIVTAVKNPTNTLMSDYTTMELFQQITKTAPATPAPSSSGAAPSDPNQECLQQSGSLSENTTGDCDPKYLTDGTVNYISSTQHLNIYSFSKIDDIYPEKHVTKE